MRAKRRCGRQVAQAQGSTGSTVSTYARSESVKVAAGAAAVSVPSRVTLEVLSKRQSAVSYSFHQKPQRGASAPAQSVSTHVDFGEIKGEDGALLLQCKKGKEAYPKILPRSETGPCGSDHSRVVGFSHEGENLPVGHNLKVFAHSVPTKARCVCRRVSNGDRMTRPPCNKRKSRFVTNTNVLSLAWLKAHWRLTPSGRFPPSTSFGKQVFRLVSSSSHQKAKKGVCEHTRGFLLLCKKGKNVYPKILPRSETRPCGSDHSRVS